MGPAEADRLTFVALAQHVLRYRPANVGGLFQRLLTQRCFHFVTQEDEEVAVQRLKRHLYEGPGRSQRVRVDNRPGVIAFVRALAARGNGVHGSARTEQRPPALRRRRRSSPSNA
jgi:hypothetical protein